ncbi:hypothetical protein CTI12_AA127490 [Artemisia annua]|uniref:Uncharacterized protein n=1 Tax=Artemisia annua TaxID=35608 RepID=A0A2U1PPK2_ARTAN|nr:hypothetical protein CTI12_AA127490 [Artemisia annua]
MVAIAIYKGNLHHKKTTTTSNETQTQEWLMPVRTISPKDFKTLIHRRNKALSTRGKRLRNPKPDPSYPNPNPSSHHHHHGSDEEKPQQEEEGELDIVVNKEVKDGCDEIENGGKLVAVTANDSIEIENGGVKVEANVDDQDLQQLPPEDNTLSDKEERKKEIEEKLKILNERKHKLVQVLKQILNAEEELRRRSNVQGITGRPVVSLQVDVPNDSGSMSRDVTPRPGSEGNCIGDLEGADADGAPNQNLHSRNITRMSSMSPSSDSLHRRGPFSMVPNPSRGTLGVVASSPSRFAPTPTGQQGNPGSLPTVSVTGTNYVASSPSPAGSGGTSVFRDARLPSPWS